MRPPKIELKARPGITFRLPDKAVALWDKTMKGPSEGVTIQILAPIYDDPEAFSAAKMLAAIDAAKKQPLTLNINSPGGDYFEGVTIFNLLAEYPNRITVNVMGEAASAASVIAMAGDRIRMYSGALMMIHGASGLAIGNAQDMRDLAGILEKIDTVVADLYSQRTGMAPEEVRKLMKAETWMTPDEALAYGFADEIVQEPKKPAKAKQASTLTASGDRRAEFITLSSNTPGVSGLSLTKGIAMQTSNERIQALESSLASRVARMQALDEEVAKAGVTFDAAQQEEFDTLDGEVDQLNRQIKAARRTAELALLRAKPIDPSAAIESVSAVQAREPSRSTPGVPVLTGARVHANAPQGIEVARYAMALIRSEGNHNQALQIVQSNRRWMDQTPQVAQFLMTAVGAGTTGGSAWADDLVYAQNFSAGFVGLLDNATIVDRIPGLTRVPFDIRFGTLTSGLTGYWVGEARPIPLSKFATDVGTLTHHKLAGLASISRELANSSEPSAEALVRDRLVAAIVALLDLSFIDPDRVAVSGVSPASVTNGVSPVTPTGTTLAYLRTDIATLMGKFDTAKIPTVNGVWIMTPRTARALSMMQNAVGNQEFPGMTARGGTFMGDPVVVSLTALTTASPTGGDMLIYMIPSEIYVADSRTVDVTVSREATIEMSDAPANRADNGTGASANLVSMFQNDSLAIRGIRDITWAKARSAAVQFINDCAYAA